MLTYDDIGSVAGQQAQILLSATQGVDPREQQLLTWANDTQMWADAKKQELDAKEKALAVERRELADLKARYQAEMARGYQVSSVDRNVKKSVADGILQALHQYNSYIDHRLQNMANRIFDGSTAMDDATQCLSPPHSGS